MLYVTYCRRAHQQANKTNKQASKRTQGCLLPYRCLQNKRPLQSHTPRVSTPLPSNFSVDIRIIIIIIIIIIIVMMIVITSIRITNGVMNTCI